MLYLGCPIWTAKSWLGNFLPQGTFAPDSLAAYSRRLNMIEGNTTFYGMPSRDVIVRWRDSTPPEFRFCLKFPRAISHDKELVNCEEETAEWIHLLRLLEDRAGPSFLQLPRHFGPDRLPVLRRYLEALPKDLLFAVEPRHPAWFQETNQDDLKDLLAGLGIAWVLYDVRPLRAADSSNSIIRIAQDKKPNVPVRTIRTAQHTMVRFIGHPDVETNGPWLEQWEARVGKWITEGGDVYFCMHSIHDSDMPALCRNFHNRLAANHIPVPPLPKWADASPNVQMSLF